MLERLVATLQAGRLLLLSARAASLESLDIQSQPSEANQQRERSQEPLHAARTSRSLLPAACKPVCAQH